MFLGIIEMTIHAATMLTVITQLCLYSLKVATPPPAMGSFHSVWGCNGGFASATLPLQFVRIEMPLTSLYLTMSALSCNLTVSGAFALRV
jgi:hypothetical protein